MTVVGSKKMLVYDDVEPNNKISIFDRGPGIDPEDRQRLFSPFEQGGDQVTGKPAGIGIGLHEARTIARLHNGDLDHYDREGGGSEFRLVLPLQQTVDPLPEELTTQVMAHAKQ